jgi:hypothetical protein
VWKGKVAALSQHLPEETEENTKELRIGYILAEIQNKNLPNTQRFFTA